MMDHAEGMSAALDSVIVHPAWVRENLFSGPRKKMLPLSGCRLCCIKWSISEPFQEQNNVFSSLRKDWNLRIPVKNKQKNSASMRL